jgi:Tripartite tricarboxylate transporter family receptor
MQFRMGVNLGDVICDEARIYGDGVNVAASVVIAAVMIFVGFYVAITLLLAAPQPWKVALFVAWAPFAYALVTAIGAVFLIVPYMIVATPMALFHRWLLLNIFASAGPAAPKIRTSIPIIPIQGLVLDQWLGVFVPAGTPSAIAARLNAEINNALVDSAVRESFLQSAQEPLGGTAAQFARVVHDDYDKYARLARELDIKMN